MYEGGYVYKWLREIWIILTIYDVWWHACDGTKYWNHIFQSLFQCSISNIYTARSHQRRPVATRQWSPRTSLGLQPGFLQELSLANKLTAGFLEKKKTQPLVQNPPVTNKSSQKNTWILLKLQKTFDSSLHQTLQFRTVTHRPSNHQLQNFLTLRPGTIRGQKALHFPREMLGFSPGTPLWAQKISENPVFSSFPNVAHGLLKFIQK